MIGLAVLGAAGFGALRTSGAESPPVLSSLSKPAGGDLQIVFRGGAGPFRVQSKASMDPGSAWVDLTKASVTELQTGVYLAMIPSPKDTADPGFYRVVSEGESVIELKGWTILLNVSAPANGTYYVAGEAPVVTVRILDNYAQGITRDSLSGLNLYLYGPEDPTKSVTASKLLNASTDRTKSVHHYINLKTAADVKADGNVFTYNLKPITDEAAGTYTMGVRATLAADGIQSVIRYAQLQIGTADVEKPLVSRDACAACHEGPISGKMYMHHADPGRSPTGSWDLDYQPVTSCKLCHNLDGYASYIDPSTLGTTTTNRISDSIVIRVHGVHSGDELSNYWNTNSINGAFKDYTGVAFPADVRNCNSCHSDDRWKTKPTRLACGSCHDNTWFGPAPAPEHWVAHPGGPAASDATCSICHSAAPGGAFASIPESHKLGSNDRVPLPKMDAIDITMTPPANGTHYVAGEKPVVTLVIKDDAGNPIDHTKVTDANFSTASLFVYGPRARAVPVLTSSATNVNSKLRASVTSSKAGPWAIKGKIFKLSVNRSAPQEIVINGAADLVTAAEVVASLNPVITNLNGGALATVSGANVNIKTLIQGSDARFEIYNGDVTTAMGWKRAPNTTMDPDITIAAGSTQGNDLRGLSDPLDYADPRPVRTAANITYQLDDVAGLPAGTYNIYAYQLPKAGKIATITNLTGVGYINFQVGTKTPEKKVAGNCASCHAETIFHFTGGPIHAEPFDTDQCNACHDYGHNAPGEWFKNQGGTSLNGWSGFGAMPIVRRVHGVHRAHYLEHSEEIYANATKETFGEIIFPVDIRNCTKCHSESDTWKQKPSRLACLACHDSDDAKSHAALTTLMPDPADPYGPLAVETCTICHGEGREFSPDKVHRITNPFVPPYTREPAE